MTVTKKTTYIVDAQARIPGHIKGSADFNRLVGVFVAGWQELEDELDLLLNNVTALVDNAIGVQLDTIGIILDLIRTVGEGDNEYRIRLLGEAARLAKSGEPETVIDAYKLITVALRVLLVELDPATVELTAIVLADNFTLSQDQAALNTMQEVIAAGVGTILMLQESNAFLWGDSADADANGNLPADANHGFGDSADANGVGDIPAIAGNGGKFARLLTGVAPGDLVGLPAFGWYVPLSEPVRLKSVAMQIKLGYFLQDFSGQVGVFSVY